MECTICNQPLMPKFRYCPNCGVEITTFFREEHVSVLDYDSGNYPDGFDPKLWGLE